ncbi:MAG TPA: hypothetical protein VMD48_14200 [Solirubrobacteraceae bacterium]|nr:hypothetical protein [Solirubrobacteraceae bacterium]
MKRALAAAAVLAAAAFGAASAVGDSFTPVVLNVKIASVARLHKPLRVRVSVTADAGVLDTATAPLRIRVKLAGECGGTFEYTPGVVLLDKQLKPQPSTGHPYSATTSGSGKPNRYGTQTVCVFLEEEGDDRQFATNTSEQVNVSRPCTRAAARYDVAERRHRRLAAARDRRAARRACGNGVPL